MEKTRSLSCFLLDLSPSYFAQQQGPIPLPDLLNSLLRSLFQLALRSPDNITALYVSLPMGAFKLAPLEDDHLLLTRFQFAELKETIIQRIAKIIAETNAEPFKLISAVHSLKKSFLGQALTNALCFINKQRKQRAADCKITIVSSQEDQAFDADSLIQSVFTAVKLDITVDCLSVSSKPCITLEQIAYTSQGAYGKCVTPQQLSKFFDFIFSMSSMSQQCMVLPGANSEGVDLRARCKCCNLMVQFGYACANCFSLICEKTESLHEGICRYCGVRFKVN